MLFYIVITLILLAASFFEIFVAKDKSRHAFIPLSIVLWAFSFLRWDVGTDWEGYLDIYKDCNKIDWYEWGFIHLNRLVRNTVDNYSVLLALLGGILFYFQTKSINELSLFPLTTLFILWGTNLGNVFFVRQSVAMALLMFSIVQVRDRRLVNFLLLVGVATLIHAASLAFLPVYWIYHLKVSRKHIIIAFAVSFAFAGILGSTVFGTLGSLLGGMYQAKIEGYIIHGADTTFDEGVTATELFIRTLMGKFVMIALFWFFISDRFKEQTKGLLNIFLFGVIMLPITSSLSPALSRLWTPFYYVQIFLMSYIAMSMRSIQHKSIFFFVLIAITMVRLYLKLFVDYGGKAFLPFKTIFAI